MKLELEDKIVQSHFISVEKGQSFKMCTVFDCLYMRIEPTEGQNCVNLSTGNLCTANDTDLVYDINVHKIVQWKEGE